MLKKLTSILMVAMLLVTLTPNIIFAAAQTDIIDKNYYEIGQVRSGTGFASENQAITDCAYVIDTSRYTFIRFDLSEYMSKIYSATDLTFTAKQRYTSETAVYELEAVVLSDCNETWTRSDITYNSANEGGLLNAGVAFSGSSDGGGNTYVFTNMLTAVKEALMNNPQSTYLTLRLQAASGYTGAIGLASNTMTFALNYDSDNISDETYIQAMTDSLEWSDISEQSSDAITENLSLPSKLYGADVTWTSNNAAITADGTVTQLRGENANATLTAKLNYNGAEATKNFELIIPKLSTSSISSGVTQKAHIQGTLDKQEISWGEIVCRTGDIGTYDHRVIFYQFDLSGKEAYIDKATKASFSMNAQQSGGTFKVTLLSDSDDNWDQDTLSYQMAYDLGMVTDKGHTFATGASALNGDTYTSPDFAQALKDAIAENPANSLITLRIESESGQIIFKHPTPTITIEYYDADVDTDAFFEEKKDALLWENITAQSKDNVVAHLYLPSQFYGFDVSWESDNAAINAATGEVTIGNSQTPVKLTATITDGTNTHKKEFNVTVSDKKYEIVFANDDGTSAMVYAAEATSAVLVFAAYNDNELLSLVPVTENIVAGENIINSSLSVSGADKVKIMLLEDIVDIVPLCVSKTK